MRERGNDRGLEVASRLGGMALTLSGAYAAVRGWAAVLDLSHPAPDWAVPGPWWALTPAGLGLIIALFGSRTMGGPVVLITGAIGLAAIVPWGLGSDGAAAELAAISLGAIGASALIAAGRARWSTQLNPLVVVLSATTALTLICLSVELGRVGRGWAERQQSGSLPASLIFGDGQKLPHQPTPAGRWRLSAAPLPLPDRTRPAPVEDGEAALGPPKALVSVVLVVDLEADEAPDWLRLLDTVQASRRSDARVVVKAASEAPCHDYDDCRGAIDHACAVSQDRGWDLLALRRAPDFDWPSRSPAGTAERLQIDPETFIACTQSKRARIVAERAGASVRVMKRSGLPWLDVEGFGWSEQPPQAGAVIGLIDSLINAHHGKGPMSPRMAARVGEVDDEGQ